MQESHYVVWAVTCVFALAACGEDGIYIGVRGNSVPSNDGGQPSCSDGMQNGDEEGTDCGGSACASCGSRCPGTLTGGLFCDGFESIPGPWTLVGGAAEESDTVRSGSGSARFAVVSATGRDIGVNLSESITTGTVSFRGHYFVASGGDFSSISLVSTGSSARSSLGFLERIAVSVEADRYEVFNGVAGDPYSSPSMTVPRDQWICLQLDVSISETAGSIRLRVDGTEVLSATDVNTDASLGYDFLNVGTLAVVGLVGTVVIYVDDIAFGTEPIPC